MSIEAMKQALEALESSQCFVEASANAKLLYGWGEQLDTTEDAITSLRQAIAEAEKQVTYTGNGTVGRENMTAPTGFFFQMPKQKEPVAWHEPSAYGNVTTHKDWALANGWQPLYIHPPKREWVETTEKDVHECFMLTEFDYHVDFNRDPEQWCLAFAKELSDTLKQKNGYAVERNT